MDEGTNCRLSRGSEVKSSVWGVHWPRGKKWFPGNLFLSTVWLPCCQQAECPAAFECHKPKKRNQQWGEYCFYFKNVWKKLQNHFPTLISLLKVDNKKQQQPVSEERSASCALNSTTGEKDGTWDVMSRLLALRGRSEIQISQFKLGRKTHWLALYWHCLN